MGDNGSGEWFDTKGRRPEPTQGHAMGAFARSTRSDPSHNYVID